MEMLGRGTGRTKEEKVAIVHGTGQIVEKKTATTDHGEGRATTVGTIAIELVKETTFIFATVVTIAL